VEAFKSSTRLAYKYTEHAKMYFLKKFTLALTSPPAGLILFAFAGLLLIRYRIYMGKIFVAFSYALLLLLSTTLAAGFLFESLQQNSLINESDYCLAKP
jgi:hypothetical protein